MLVRQVKDERLNEQRAKLRCREKQSENLPSKLRSKVLTYSSRNTVLQDT